MWKNFYLIIFIIYLIFSSFSLMATNTTRFVSIDGRNKGDCSINPCRTIKFSIEKAEPGDTIVVHPGIYKERILIKKPVTLMGSGASSTIIDGEGKGNIISAYRVTPFTIEGFTIKNLGKKPLSMENVGINLDGATLTDSNYWTIRRNIIQDNGTGIHVVNSLGGGELLIENNLISDNQFDGLVAGHPRAIVRNNTIVNNGWSAYIEHVGKGNNLIMNNIIAFNGSLVPSHLPCLGGVVISSGINYYISFNNVFNNKNDIYIEDTGRGCVPFTPLPGTGEISVDPKFKDIINKNYQLKSDSQAIDKGTSDGAPNIDINGESRPIDGNNDGLPVVDIGAYEFNPKLLQKYYCCSYTKIEGTTFCDASLGSYTFEKCNELAKNAGTHKFKWGQVSEATAEACWAGGTCGDVQEYLKVTLDNLTTSILENQLVIQWDTASEENNLGMNLWCAKMQDDHFKEITKLNSELILSKAILPNHGASYFSTDYPYYVNTNLLKPGVQHCALEDIDANGQCTLHCDQIDTTVVGKGQSVPNVNLNKLNAKAIALCQQYKDKLAETGQEGICLDQLLMSH